MSATGSAALIKLESGPDALAFFFFAIVLGARFLDSKNLEYGASGFGAPALSTKSEACSAALYLLLMAAAPSLPASQEAIFGYL